MKTTYLVYKQVNGVRQLVMATPAEWNAILKENRELPAEQHRYFMHQVLCGKLEAVRA